MDIESTTENSALEVLKELVSALRTYQSPSSDVILAPLVERADTVIALANPKPLNLAIGSSFYNNGIFETFIREETGLNIATSIGRDEKSSLANAKRIVSKWNSLAEATELLADWLLVYGGDNREVGERSRDLLKRLEVK